MKVHGWYVPMKISLYSSRFFAGLSVKFDLCLSVPLAKSNQPHEDFLFFFSFQQNRPVIPNDRCYYVKQ